MSGTTQVDTVQQIVIKLAMPGSISGPTGPPGTPGTRSGEAVSWSLGFPALAQVTADSYILQLDAPYAATITGVAVECPIGSFVAELLINTTLVIFTGGLGTFIADSPNKVFYAAISQNLIEVGDRVTLAIIDSDETATGGAVAVKLTIT